MNLGTGTHAINNAGGTGSITPTNTMTVISGSITTLQNNLQVDSVTVNAGGTLNITNRQLSLTGSLNNAGTFTLTGSTMIFNGSGGSPVAQTLTNSTSNFNHLTINNTSTGGSVTLGSNVTVGGNLNINAGLFDLQTFTANHTTPAAGQLNMVNGATLKIGGSNGFPANYLTHTLGQTSTVEYAGSGTQTIAAEAYGNLTSSNSGTRTLASSGTIGIFTTFTPGTNSYTITGSTIEYNGTSAQTLPSSGFNTYNNLTINNAAGVTNSNSALTVNGLLDVKKGTFTTSSTFNNVQIDSAGPGVLAGVTGTTMNVSGNWTNNGGSATSFMANGNTVNFNGSSLQTIGGSTSTTFDNLTIANAGVGVTLGINTNVNGTLTLTNNLNTGAFTLTQNNSTPTAGNGDVIGNVKRANNGLPLPTGTAYTFGNPFNVITFSAASVLTPTDVTFNLVSAAPVDFSTAVKRTYTISQTAVPVPELFQCIPDICGDCIDRNLCPAAGVFRQVT